MRIVMVALLVTVVAGMAAAQEKWGPKKGTGLEMEPGTKFNVAVEYLPENARELGLTEEFIQSKVELQLRKNGLPVGSQEESGDCFLYVRLNMFSQAFSIAIHFERRVVYMVGLESYVYNGATTYGKSATGTHGSDSQFMVQGILDLVDIFSNDFLKANEPKAESKQPNKEGGK